tara:strand:+ start:902 stop:1198 length:297 start_codon:yes stop_codon:yes gene_type:complete
MKGFFDTKGMMRNKRALTPLLATLLLVVFALAVGTLTMSWGKTYVSGLKGDDVASSEVFSVTSAQLNTPLKQLQMEHIQGKISQQSYLQKESQIIPGR